MTYGTHEPAPLKSKWEMNFKERELDEKITKEKREQKRL